MQPTNETQTRGLNREELTREREALEKQLSELVLQRSILKRKICAIDVLIEDDADRANAALCDGGPQSVESK